MTEIIYDLKTYLNYQRHFSNHLHVGIRFKTVNNVNMFHVKYSHLTWLLHPVEHRTVNTLNTQCQIVALSLATDGIYRIFLAVDCQNLKPATSWERQCCTVVILKESCDKIFGFFGLEVTTISNVFKVFCAHYTF